MTFRSILVASAATLALAGTAAAQETTGAIRGVVTDEAGSPLAGATVTVTDTQTGRTRSFTTGGDGSFSVRNLSVSGEYTVSASAGGYQAEAFEALRLSLGNTTDLTFDLASGGMTDEIVVVGTRQAVDVATGPSTVIGLEQLETLPAINRDIKDAIRIDPRLFVDETFSDSIQCAGANPRFNSLTVDGVRLNDNFGLNSNGYPTERIPFSYDAIEQVAVELAPFDVEYGGFTACNINAVTKSGQNEFFGGAFFDYNSDSLVGDQAGDLEVDNGDFNEWRYGFNVGGPLIRDRLFFFAAYEKLEGVDLFGGNTPTGRGITDADFQAIVDAAQATYGYTVAGLPSSLPVEDEKVLAKIDWNIAEGHRAAFTFNYNDGYSNSASDGDPDELAELNHFYQRGATLHSYVGSLFSSWTDRLSTEVRIGYIDLENLQQSYGDDTIGEVQIAVGDTTVYLGEDDSRQSNELNYDLWSFKAKADYELGNHVLTLGAEREMFDVFNLFVQETEGEFRFDSIEDFAAGEVDRLIYENAAGTNDPDDGAAEFGYEVNSVYLQDVWQATTDLSITAGLRWDFYTTDDKPAFNQSFQDTYGIRNDDTLDGKGLVQPRIAFNYEPSDLVSLRGGVGLFSGGNPNVWLSNNYSNNGVTLFETNFFGANLFDDFTYSGGGQPLFDIPDEALDDVANADGRGPVNALDPNFEIPSEWKYALGTTIRLDPGAFLGEDYRLDLDLLYSDVRESAFVTPVSFLANRAAGLGGTAADGRPIYVGNTDDFVLTNAEDKGSTLVLSAGLSKTHEFGLDWGVGYAYTDAEDTNPMTSSVAFSNYQNFARSDAAFPDAATSDYEIAHRFTLRANFETEFVPDYATRFSLFGEVAEGSPYSYTFGFPNNFEPANFITNQLFYVPNSLGDPNVRYDSPETALALADFIADNEDLAEYRGQIAPRNAFADEWYSKFDLRVSQEFRGVRPGDRLEAYAIVENLANLINGDWGTRRQQGFPGSVNLVNADVDDDGTLVYSNFRGDGVDDGAIQVGPSLWQIRFGARYQF